MRLLPPGLRLLPVTIGVLSLLLIAKAQWLLQGWQGGARLMVVAAAMAGEPSSATDKPAESAHREPSGHGAKPVAGEAHGKDLASPASAAPSHEPAAPPEPQPVTGSERPVLLELRQRRLELEKRDMSVTARESVLTAAEQKIAARVAELKTLQAQLASLDAERKKREDSDWQGLVKLYEAMKPREAAAIFNDLSMSVLLPLIGRMKENKAAAILAAMLPDRAREVTTQLAKFRGLRDAPAEPNPETANPSRLPPTKS
jgi:flagellar motility protein MotE (MotC chaperone)